MEKASASIVEEEPLGLESISAIIVNAFSRPAGSNLPSDRRKSSSSLSSGRKESIRCCSDHTSATLLWYLDPSY